MKWIAAATILAAAAVPTYAQGYKSASCYAGGKIGSASCAAVCPSGMLALNCSYTLGNYTSGDTCRSLARIQAGPVAANGQPSQQPHDRCNFSVQCSDGQGKLSVQGFATCVQP
jgi:hypothetical protein